jgi:hypothetical protein
MSFVQTLYQHEVTSSITGTILKLGRGFISCALVQPQFCLCLPVYVYSSSFHIIPVVFLFQAKLESRVSLLEQEVAKRPDIDTVAYRYQYRTLRFLRYGIDRYGTGLLVCTCSCWYQFYYLLDTPYDLHRDLC